MYIWLHISKTLLESQKPAAFASYSPITCAVLNRSTNMNNTRNWWVMPSPNMFRWSIERFHVQLLNQVKYGDLWRCRICGWTGTFNQPLFKAILNQSCLCLVGKLDVLIRLHRRKNRRFRIWNYFCSCYHTLKDMAYCLFCIDWPIMRPYFH